MTALAPLFLSFLPLAALPLLFHLFFRVRRRRRTFPSLLFFLAADPRVHYRRKLREWLLLLLRTLALLCLLLGLSRPVFRGSGGAPRKLAVVVDNSASMRAVDASGRSYLSQALAIAAALIEGGGADLTLAVSTVDDLRAALPDTYGTEPPPLCAALETLSETSAAGRPLAAAERAVAAGTAVPGVTELHVLTDGVGPEWSAAAAQRLPQTVRVFMHALGGRGARGEPLVLQRITPPPTVLAADRAWFTDIDVANQSRSAIEATVVCRAGESEWRGTRTIPAGGGQSLRAVMPGLPAGQHAVSVRLEGDAAPGFDKGFFEVNVLPPRAVIILGEAEASGMLPAALDPVGDGRLSGYRVHIVATPAEAERLSDVAAAPALVGACFETAARYDVWLRMVAERGATVLLYPAPREVGAAALPTWCGSGVAGPAAPLPKGATLDVVWDDPLWLSAGRIDGGGLIDVTRAVMLVPTADTRVAARAGGGAVLTIRELGHGRVIVSGLAWEPTWSAWPRRAAFVPMLLAFPAALPPTSFSLVTAGGRLAVPLVAQEEADLRDEAGALVWRGSGAHLTVAPAVPGYFTLNQGTNRWTFAVVGDTADAAPVVAAARPAMAPAWAPQAIRLVPDDAADALRLVARARRGTDLTPWFLIAALLCQVAELAVAHHRVFRHG